MLFISPVFLSSPSSCDVPHFQTISLSWLSCLAQFLVTMLWAGNTHRNTSPGEVCHPCVSGSLWEGCWRGEVSVSADYPIRQTFRPLLHLFSSIYQNGSTEMSGVENWNGVGSFPTNCDWCAVSLTSDLHTPRAGPWLGLCLTDLLSVLFVPPPSFCNQIDHIALIIELLGSVPRKLIMAGKYSKDFFTKKGKRVTCRGVFPSRSSEPKDTSHSMYFLTFPH